jgi:hypothetical protein
VKFIGQVFGIAIAGAIIAICGLFGWKLFVFAQAVFEGAKTLEPAIYVPLTVTVTTAVLGLGATLYTQSRSRKRDIEAAFRERKVEIYLDFLKTMEQVLLAGKPELGLAPIDQNALVIKLVSIRTHAVLWGSSGVLKELSNFTKVGEGNPKKMFRVIEKLQREMRNDLGLSNSGLEQDFFSRLILSNPNDFDTLDS